MKVTSTSIEVRGAHAHVWVWIDGKQSGELVVGADEVDDLADLLQARERRSPFTTRELERLRLAHEGAEQAWRRAETENDQLRAEVTRLREELAGALEGERQEGKAKLRVRAELRAQETATERLSKELVDSNTRLAAANALLKRVSADWNRPSLWAKDVAAHLSGAAALDIRDTNLTPETAQAAHEMVSALTRTEAEQAPPTPLSDDLGEALAQVVDAERTEAEHRGDGSCDVCGFAPVLPVNLCGQCREVNETAKRTEAEQAVLDAMGDVQLGLLRAWCAKHGERSVMGSLARAELARRGVKP